MRILYENSLARNPAGTGVFVRGLLAGLQQLSDLDIVTVQKPGSAATLDVASKSVGRRLRNGFDHVRYYASTLQQQAARSGCDVILCPTPLAPLRSSIPTIVTVFDLSPQVLPGMHDWMSRYYLRAMVRLSLFRARGICAISQAVAAEILAHFRTLPHERVFVAYPGPNPDLIGAQPLPAPTVQRPFVLMVGTLEPRKNHLTVLRALADHLRRQPASDLRVVLAGSPGWGYRPLLRAIDELGLSTRVVRLGATRTETLKWLYTTASALFFPSLYEGFGIPVLEALALQCPVVAARIPPVVELVGSNGAVLREATDVSSWSAALDDVAAGRLDGALRAAGLARSRAFTWEACAQSVLAGVRRALASG